MKVSRFISVLLSFVFAFSAWGTPSSSVYAKSVDASGINDINFSVDLVKKPKTASLIVENWTKGKLYVYLSGPANYSFVVTKAKMTLKNIVPGQYTIVLRSSACSGSLTVNRKINGKRQVLGPIICSKNSL